MSCPGWTSLAAHRHDGGPEPEGWSDALAHFDGGCRLCRKAALQADPTLVFRRLAAVPASRMTEAQERAEVDSVRQAVAAMRAASRLEGPRRAAGGWKRWSVAAALAMAALSIPSDNSRQSARQAPIFRDGLVAEDAAGSPVLTASQGGSPVLDGVDLPDARVYHLNGDGLSVTMVVGESLDL